MKNEITLRPYYVASVSGGKDSLYMLNLILHKLDKYPLDAVIHYELEIDYPFIKNVVDYMERECKKHNIPFYRIKPRKSWEELYNKYDLPTRVARWCNSKYKTDCIKQFDDFLKTKAFYSVSYIGFCADEAKRFKYEIGNIKEGQKDIYPLAEEGIEENTILEWAKDIPMYNNWYKIFKRQGCKFCPMATRLELAYNFKFYPEETKIYMDRVRKWEKHFNSSYWGKYNADYMEKCIKEKWLPRLEEKLKEIE